jgi:hypothetical protein
MEELSPVGTFDGGPPKNIADSARGLCWPHGQRRDADADLNMQCNLREIQYIIDLLLHAERA